MPGLSVICAHRAVCPTCSATAPVPAQASPPGRELTRRQQQCLELLADGMSHKEIGQALWLSENTIGRHLRGLFRALGVHSAAGAVGAGFRHGLIE